MSAVAERSRSNSMLLWLDGVGVFSVLLSDEVVVGRVSDPNSTTDDEADIALMGNLSRRHVVLQRAGEDYVLSPLGKTMLNGRIVTERTVLPTSCEWRLNDAVQLRFEVPSPLSASARVEVLSNHRGRRAMNGFVLMAETCLLGPGPENHIRCPQWPSQLVLVRRDGELAVKSKASLTIDGMPCSGLTVLKHGQTVAGEGLRMRVEHMP